MSKINKFLTKLKFAYQVAFSKEAIVAVRDGELKGTIQEYKIFIHGPNSTIMALILVEKLADHIHSVVESEAALFEANSIINQLK